MASYNHSNLVEENRHVQNESSGTVKQKSLLISYLLWFPFGILGFHRFYLGYWFMGTVYIFTGGYCGIGWIVDGFCMPSMVRETNSWLEFDAVNPRRDHYKSCTSEVSIRYGCACGRGVDLRWRTLRDARILTLNPLGIIGIQHQYLGRPWYRLAYNLTAGLFVVGWITDMFRLPSLVKQVNTELQQIRNGMSMTELKRQDLWDCKTSEAYIFGVPCGFFGMHHFYLGRYGFGFTYLFTGGLFGIGWLVDLLRMSRLVELSNEERKTLTLSERNVKHIDDAYLLAFPLGIFGAHHFYLNRPGFGFLYIFTLGLFGFGWLVDLFRMPLLVREANLRNKQIISFYHFPASNQYNTYPGYASYPNAPSQNGHHYPTQNGPTSYQSTEHPPPNGHHYPTQNGPISYQSTEQPPQYTESVPTDGYVQPPTLKQYPPP